jgi:hypothetical protein
MIVNRYKYYFQIGAALYEVYPSNDVIVKGDKFTDEGHCVAYRKSIDSVKISKTAKKPNYGGFGDVKNKKVFQEITQIYRDQEQWDKRMYFIVRDTLFSVDQKYVFNVVDCKFDFHRGKLEIEFKNRDDYYVIDEKGDEEIDIFDYVFPSERKSVEVKVLGDVSNIEWRTHFGDRNTWYYDLNPTYEEVINIEGTGEKVDVYAIVTCSAKPPFSDGWQFDELEERWFADPSDVNNGYIKGFEVYGFVLPDGIPNTDENIRAYVLQDIVNRGLKDLIHWYRVKDLVFGGRPSILVFAYNGFQTQTAVIDNTIKLSDAMTVVCREQLGLTVDAYWSRIFGGKEPVICQKSDFKRYESSNNANKFEFSFNQLLQMLRAVRNVMWWVRDGVIYFRPPDMISAILNPPYDFSDKKTESIFETDYENIPWKEDWKFMEQGSTLFDETVALYNPIVKSIVDDNQYTHDAGNVTVDLNYIFYNIEEVNDDGMVLMACNLLVGGDTDYRCSIDDIGNGTFQVNGILSTRNIIDGPFKYFRPLKKYYYNSRYTEVFTSKTLDTLVSITVKNIQLQDNQEFTPERKVKIKIYSEFDGEDVIIDTFVKSYEYNCKTRRLDLILTTEVIP